MGSIPSNVSSARLMQGANPCSHKQEIYEVKNMITIWHKCEPPRDEYVLAVTPKAHHYTNIGIVKPRGLVNVFELRDGGYVFLSEVKMWCRLPKDRENRKSKYIEEQ